jgi:hypothetical protein
MVADQQLNVAGITNAQLGALPDDKIGEPLHVDIVGSAFLTPTVVNRNVKQPLHKGSDSFVHGSTPK